MNSGDSEDSHPRSYRCRITRLCSRCGQMKPHSCPSSASMWHRDARLVFFVSVMSCQFFIFIFFHLRPPAPPCPRVTWVNCVSLYFWRRTHLSFLFDDGYIVEKPKRLESPPLLFSYPFCLVPLSRFIFLIESHQLCLCYLDLISTNQ